MKYKQISARSVPRKTAVCRALATMAGAVFLSVAAWADTGGLRIVVSGSDGKPLSGVTVKIGSPSSLLNKTVVTEADGSARVSGLDPARDYKVEVTASGFKPFSADNVAVIGGQSVNLGYVLSLNNLDSVVVTGRSLAAMDTTSATVGTVLTLDVLESLPTSRSYTSYLQLVPGVKPGGSNPSSKSGVNYADIGGATGTSTDNVYILDGVDVTDHQTGTFGANFNSEIIQEQRVLTGGIPAEYAGGSGLLSIVTTKSGSDEFSGSINYFVQNDGLMAKNINSTTSGFSNYDTAVTLGGPIIPGKMWFFGSYQMKNGTTKVNDTTGNFLRDSVTKSSLGFFKTTWQVTPQDRMVASYFNDPLTSSGSTSSSVNNNRDTKQSQGGDNYRVEYTHDADDWRFNAYAFKHTGEVSVLAADPSTRNDVAFKGITPTPTIAQRSQGGYGSSLETWRNRDELGLSFEYFLDTATSGKHAIKTGLSSSINTYKENSIVTGAEASSNARYTSMSVLNSGFTLAQYFASGWSGTKSIATVDTGLITSAINGSADKAYYLGLLDTNRDGAVSSAELQAYRLTDTAGNPTGDVNVYRIKEVSRAPYNVKATGNTFYVQDSWTLGKLTANVGVRAEEWTHFDSKGDQTHKFKWEFAPRVSTVWDINGDGRSKVWGFAGRYYDPVRTNMSDFAGALTGPVLSEQVKLGDKWLPFRTRGGETTPDAVFAPSTKTPYTDELLLGYAFNAGKDYTVSVTYTKRFTTDLLEDYDLHLYSDPTNTGVGANEGYAPPSSKYYLPYSYYGYSGVPNANYVIANLAGGKREYQGIELSLTKQRSDNWQGGMSYTWNDASGNSNSDSNADYQGDWIALDPRAPNMFGPQPGNIKHQVKAWGTYFLDSGLELGGVFNWNSGVLYSRTQLIGGRNLPVMSDGYVDSGVADSWVLPDSVGSQKAPDYFTMDVRVKYTQPLGGKQKIEYFMDIFNIFNKQSATTQMSVVTGSGAYLFAQDTAWVTPMRAYLGARYSF